ncbi:MAG: hypothetical protein K5655_03440 [Lachnospiraceae bacterium]|jgi:hypothetical protein|nr:hypothetical protein [Lachnospiraceae bacterium]
MGLIRLLARIGGKCLRKVGDLIGSDTLSGIGDRMHAWGADYENMDYDESSSSSEDIIRNDRAFQDAYRNLEQCVKDDERKIISQIAKEIEESAKILLDEFPFQSGIEEIQRIHDTCRVEMHELFDGKFVEYASKRFSMDNSSCQKAMALSLSNGRVEALKKQAEEAQSYARKKWNTKVKSYRDKEILRMLTIAEDAANDLKNHIDESAERLNNLKEKNKDDDSLNMEIAKQLIMKEKMLLLRDFLAKGSDNDSDYYGDQL